MEYKKLLNNANKEVEKIISFIKENDDMFDMMDLKLHELECYCYSNLENDYPLVYEEYKDIFYDYCDLSYNFFIDWCSMEGIDFNKMRHQVGRTSKFYLHNFDKSQLNYTLYDILYENANWWYSDYVAFDRINGLICDTEIENYEDETIEVLEYISNDFYNDFIKSISDMKKVYDYIKEFKENQVEYFKDYAKDLESDLEYELECENKKIQEILENKEKIISEIKTKYNISEKDFNLLKENL